MTVEAVLNPLGQEEVCDIELPDATDTPLHWLLPSVQPPAPPVPRRRKQCRYKEEKSPSVGLSDHTQRGRGRGRERLKQRWVDDDSEPTN